MTDRVIFRLKRWWPPDAPREEQFDCYEAIKEGRKTSEWRDCSDYWWDRLYIEGDDRVLRPKVKRAWFIVGFPKGNVPRLEADIKGIYFVPDDKDHIVQFEIQFENVVEVTE